MYAIWLICSDSHLLWRIAVLFLYNLVHGRDGGLVVVTVSTVNYYFVFLCFVDLLIFAVVTAWLWPLGCDHLQYNLSVSIVDLHCGSGNRFIMTACCVISLWFVDLYIGSGKRMIVTACCMSSLWFVYLYIGGGNCLAVTTCCIMYLWLWFVDLYIGDRNSLLICILTVVTDWLWPLVVWSLWFGDLYIASGNRLAVTTYFIISLSVDCWFTYWQW